MKKEIFHLRFYSITFLVNALFCLQPKTWTMQQLSSLDLQRLTDAGGDLKKVPAIYPCSACSLSFKFAQTLEEHQKLHQNLTMQKVCALTAAQQLYHQHLTPTTPMRTPSPAAPIQTEASKTTATESEPKTPYSAQEEMVPQQESTPYVVDTMPCANLANSWHQDMPYQQEEYVYSAHDPLLGACTEEYPFPLNSDMEDTDIPMFKELEARRIPETAPLYSLEEMFAESGAPYPKELNLVNYQELYRTTKISEPEMIAEQRHIPEPTAPTTSPKTVSLLEDSSRENSFDATPAYQQKLSAVKYAKTPVKNQRHQGRGRPKGHYLPQKCHVCRKTFTTIHLLAGHMLLHTNTKPRQHCCPCDDCGYSSDQVTNVRRHVEKVHVKAGESVLENYPLIQHKKLRK